MLTRVVEVNGYKFTCRQVTRDIIDTFLTMNLRMSSRLVTRPPPAEKIDEYQPIGDGIWIRNEDLVKFTEERNNVGNQALEKLCVDPDIKKIDEEYPGDVVIALREKLLDEMATIVNKANGIKKKSNAFSGIPPPPSPT